MNHGSAAHPNPGNAAFISQLKGNYETEDHEHGADGKSLD